MENNNNIEYLKYSKEITQSYLRAENCAQFWFMLGRFDIPFEWTWSPRMEINNHNNTSNRVEGAYPDYSARYTRVQRNYKEELTN